MRIIKKRLADNVLDISDSSLTCYLRGQNANLRAILNYPAIIICPGGGYTQLSDRESEIIALSFLAKGYHSFVLNYSLVSDSYLYPKPLVEMAKVFQFINENAEKYHINLDKIATIGFSAGGHVVSWYNSLPDDWITQYTNVSVIKPTKQILCYPLIDFSLTNGFSKGQISNILGTCLPGATQKMVSKKTPPTFIWTTNTDELVPSKNTTEYILALQKYSVDYEAHVFGWGPHGLSLSNEQTNYLPTDSKHSNRCFVNIHDSAWFPLAVEWLERKNYDIK